MILKVRIHIGYDEHSVKTSSEKLRVIVRDQIASVLDQGLFQTEDGELIDSTAVDASWCWYSIPPEPSEVLSNLNEAITELEDPGSWKIHEVQPRVNQARECIEKVIRDIYLGEKKVDGKKSQ